MRFPRFFTTILPLVLFSAASAQAATVNMTFQALTTSSNPPSYSAAFPNMVLSFSYDDAVTPMNGLYGVAPANVGVTIGGTNPITVPSPASSVVLNLLFAAGQVTDFAFDFLHAFSSVDINQITATKAGGQFGGEFFGGQTNFVNATAQLGPFSQVVAPIPLPAPAVLLGLGLFSLGFLGRRRRHAALAV